MFDKRSTQKELLDESDIQMELLYQNLKELEFINKYLGGHLISTKGMNAVLVNRSKTYHIIDIGCGGGDSLKAIADWSKGKNIKIHLTGIDLKQDCIDYSKNNCKKYKEIQFRCDDFRNAFSKGNKMYSFLSLSLGVIVVNYLFNLSVTGLCLAISSTR